MTQVESAPLEVRPPPVVDPPEGGVLVAALPMLGSVGSVVLVASSVGDGGTAHRGYLAAGLFLLATLGFVGVQVDRQRQQRARRVTRARDDYRHHLEDVRRRAREAARQQRDRLVARHPPPDALPALVAAHGAAARRDPADADFLHVRHGTRPAPLAPALLAGEEPPAGADPACALARRRLLDVHATLPDLPALLDLRGLDRVVLAGEAAPARDAARALVCAAATSHAPAHLAVAVLTDRHALVHWDWVKWLPHARGRHDDAVGPRRLVVTDPAELAELLPRDAHVLLVSDGTRLPPGCGVRPEGVTVLDVGGDPSPGPRTLRLDAEAADRCPPATAEALARRLAPLGTATGTGGGTGTDAAGLLGLGDVSALDPVSAWGERPDRERLRVPIGTDGSGRPVHLDLKEAARGGAGPHGLVVGATGSGKSELLRTLVLGLVTRHSPEQLNLALVDFKGGATFAGMADLPHVSAVITNLSDELALVDRMHDVLAGELVRRQEVLRAAGHLASAHELERARADGAAWPPLPTLLVVVDEFSELLSARPELVELFVAIGRLGRSLGVHLLLASQRLEEGRLRGLESHLSYRIGLRTHSAGESRTVLGVPDAHTLPPRPGAGYLRSGPDTLQRFDAAYVSGPGVRREPHAGGVLPFTVATVGRPAPAVAARGPSLLEVAVDRLAGHGPPARRMWLPPLEVPETLGGLLGELVADSADGLLAPRWRGRSGPVVPLGTLDRPRQQRREPLTVDLGAAGGHVAVVGGPRSGRTTLLRTLVAGLALTRTPREARVFLLDLGGGLTALAGLPHVAALATRGEPELVRRTVAEVERVVARREAGGAVPGPVVLLVDGWGFLRGELDDVELALAALAARGPAVDVHLVASAARWSDFRTGVRDVFGTRLELRLGDPLDSEVDRRAAADVPPRPGRGLVTGPLHFLSALPRLDGDPDPASAAAGLADLVDRVAAAWTGPRGHRVRALPEQVGADEVAAAAGDSGDRLRLGLDEQGRAALLDPATDPHLLVLGGPGSGRTGALHRYVREVLRTRDPRRAQLLLVDPRGSLDGLVPGESLLGRVRTSTACEAALRDLVAHLEDRLAGTTPAGPDVFVVVDDHDLMGPAPALAPLAALLPRAGECGLHLAVVRRAGSRAWPEPTLSLLEDLGAARLELTGGPVAGRARLTGRDRATAIVQLTRPPTPPGTPHPWSDPQPLG